MQGLSPTPPQPARHVDINPDVPAYRVVEKRGFFDDSDHLWDKGSMIYWEGAPNMGLEPLNDMAYEIMLEWLTKIDGEAEKVGKAKGMGHATLVNAFEARHRIAELQRKFGRSVDIEEQTPILGGRREQRKLAHSVYSGAPQQTPMMGHQGRQTAIRKQAGSDREQMNDRSQEKIADSTGKAFI